MLTEDEMKRIAVEEHYRHSIRKSLEGEVVSAVASEGRHFGRKAFEFFNSSLGMWLLSSVVLTGGAAMIQQIQHSHEIAMKNRADLFTHHFEIQGRVDNMAFLLRRATTTGEAKTALSGIYKSEVPLAPELQNRSLAGLYLSVYPLLVGNDREKTSKAFNLVKQLEEVELLLQSQPDDKPLDMAQRNHIQKLLTTIQQLHVADA